MAGSFASFASFDGDAAQETGQGRYNEPTPQTTSLIQPISYSPYGQMAVTAPLEIPAGGYQRQITSFNIEPTANPGSKPRGSRNQWVIIALLVAIAALLNILIFKPSLFEPVKTKSEESPDPSSPQPSPQPDPSSPQPSPQPDPSSPSLSTPSQPSEQTDEGLWDKFGLRGKFDDIAEESKTALLKKIIGEKIEQTVENSTNQPKQAECLKNRFSSEFTENYEHPKIQGLDEDSLQALEAIVKEIVVDCLK